MSALSAVVGLLLFVAVLAFPVLFAGVVWFPDSELASKLVGTDLCVAAVLLLLHLRVTL